jgi:hypothetical protein
MRFFAIFFAIITLVCGGFWLFDKPGSGMVYPTIGFAVLAGCVLLFNKFFRGGWLSDKAESSKLNSIALPLLFLLNFHVSGWWLLALLFVAVWAWALTRKSSGDYDFGPGFALVGALIFSVACAVGVGAGLLLR